MSPGLFWPLSICGFAALSLVCGILAWPQLAAVWPSIQEQIDRFRRMPPLAKVVLLLFVGAFVVYGGTKTNLVDQTSVSNIVEIVEGGTNDMDGANGAAGVCALPPGGIARRAIRDEPPTVTPEDIARGWQQVEVRTNCNIFYTMPEGAVLASNWWVRGAYEDCSIVRLGDCSIGCYVNQSNNPNNRTMSFPFGTNEYDSAWAFSRGKIRFTLADKNEIVAVGAPMSAVPYCSRLWSAIDTNGSQLVTWESFALNRNTNTPANAQIELRMTGDFVTRSNEVETVCRRVDPDDYDGDGWRNDDDPDPCAWDEFWESFYQELPDGDDECNYCWIEIRPQWNSWIEFEGDGPSNLEDPCFWGKAGETYRVMLLIGKTYDVMSTQPLSVVGQSDVAIQVSDVEPCSFSVVWPVTFTVGEGRYATRPLLGATWNDGGRSFYVLRDPPFLRGNNVWSEGCCLISGDGTNYTFACDNACTCEGCMSYGSFIYSGYMLNLPGWFECGCHYVPDEGPASVSISFDRSAVIYEDPYTNMPGEEVHPVRSNAVLRCSVSGGTYGGTLSVMLSDAAHQKLRMVRGDVLPTDVRINPGASRSYEVIYSVLEPSDSVGDIVAAAVFHEDFLNVVHSNDTSMTSVKVELEAVYIAPTNHNQSRHVYGVGEKVRFKITPQSSEIMLKTHKHDRGDEGRVYELFDGSVECDASSIREYVCPISANYHPPIRIMLDDVEYRPSISLVEPQTVITPDAFWGENHITDMFYDGNRKCWPFGQVGEACLGTTNYVGPMHVSFQGIAVSEIPCDIEDVITGCFTNGHHRTHVKRAGAGRAYYIQEGNFWFRDGARSGAPETNWSPDSTLSWLIPVGWHRKNPLYTDEHGVETFDFETCWDENSRPLLFQGRIDIYKQIRHIDNVGVYRTDKFGHWISRSPECRVILDGVTLQERHGE